MDDLISIVLPVYNGEKYLHESIQSVMRQTYTNWELIVMDDRSVDNTCKIVNEYRKWDQRIRYYLNEENLKLPRNLNRGFSLAKGDYLTWTSDDNRYKEKALETMLSRIKENQDADLVYASYEIIDDKGNLLGDILADGKAKEHILGSNVIGACFLYTRKAYEMTGAYDKDLLYVEDFDYWQRMVAKVKSVAISECLYEYRWHENSMTSTKKMSDYGAAMERMLLKNKKLYEPLSLEQRRFFTSCLRKSYEAQGKKSMIAVEDALYRMMDRIDRVFFGRRN